MAELLTLPGAIAEPGQDNFKSSRIPLIAYARDRATLDKLREALSAQLGPEAIFRQGGMKEAREGLRQQTGGMAALVLDVSGENSAVAALEDLALYVEPGVSVFVIGDDETVDFYRYITRTLGVQEYLCKPLNREQIARTFLPWMLGRGTQSLHRSGQVVTVTGVRGGVGATTIAVNLAMQLAERSRHHTLLLDADLHGGSAALMLQGTTSGGLRTALENPGRVDALFAERSSPSVTERLSLLAAEESLGSLVEPTSGAARHLIGVMRDRFNFVVVDLPRSTNALNHELRELAHVQILVMDPTLAALRDTLRFLGLPQGPNQASRPVVILNRARAPGGLTNKQVSDGLDGRIDGIIPWLPKKIPIAATLGKPAVSARGPFRTAIDKLADEITPRRSDATPEPKAARKRRWWRK